MPCTWLRAKVASSISRRLAAVKPPLTRPTLLPTIVVTCWPGSSQLPSNTGTLELVAVKIISTPRTASSGEATGVMLRFVTRSHFFGEFFPIRRAAAVDFHFFQLAHLHEREQMILRLAGGAEKAETRGVGPREQVGADGAGGSRAKTGDGDIIRQLGAGDLADDDAFELAFGGVIKHDHRMIEPGINLLVGHRLDPFAVGHQAGGFGRRHAALMDAHAHSGGNVNASARRIQLRILTPFAKAQTHSLHGFRHGDDAANFLWAHQKRLQL